MPNVVDKKIAEITDQHTGECERLNVSRNVMETKRRIEAALPEFSRVDVAASGYWEGLSDAAKMLALRAAIVELAGNNTVLLEATAQTVGDLDERINELADPLKPAPKKARKAKGAA